MGEKKTWKFLVYKNLEVIEVETASRKVSIVYARKAQTRV